MGELVVNGEAIPYCAMSNDELGETVRAGDRIVCPACGGTHVLHGGKDDKGRDSELLLCYFCGDKTLLAAVNNRIIDKTGIRKLEE